MISLPGFFLALTGAALLAALIAIFRSAHAAFGGGAVWVESGRDLPERAQLIEEKTSLLRAIKDLEYERAVGKIGDADYQRLDAAYRARAKQVLAQLDQDTEPLREEAEKLIEAYLRGRVEASPAEEMARPRKRKGKIAEKFEAATHRAADHDVVTSEAGASLDDVLTRIQEGTITVVPEAPASWPYDAKKMWSSTLARALDEAKAKRARAREASAETSPRAAEREAGGAKAKREADQEPDAEKNEGRP